MKIALTLSASALLVSLLGCSATIALNKVQTNPQQSLTVRDNRPAEERVYRRDGVQSPIQYFGDEDFDSPPLTQFSALLGAGLPPGNYTLEVAKFRVIDIFPQRLGSATAAAVTGALGSMGYSAYFADSRSPTQDNITCLISGRVQSKTVDASASVPYKISPLAGMVKNDPSFKEAVNECLRRLAESVVKT